MTSSKEKSMSKKESMPTKKNSMPSKKNSMPFEMNMRVPYFDTDKMQVVHHANYIRYFEIARTEYFRARGMAYSQMEVYNLQSPVLGVTAKFNEPAVYDETITLACRLSKLGPASLEFDYEIRNAETGAIHAVGHSRHGVVNSEYRPVALKRNYPEVNDFLKGLYEEGQDTLHGEGK